MRFVKLNIFTFLLCLIGLFPVAQPTEIDVVSHLVSCVGPLVNSGSDVRLNSVLTDSNDLAGLWSFFMNLLDPNVGSKSDFSRLKEQSTGHPALNAIIRDLNERQIVEGRNFVSLIDPESNQLVYGQMLAVSQNKGKDIAVSVEFLGGDQVIITGKYLYTIGVSQIAKRSFEEQEILGYALVGTSHWSLGQKVLVPRRHAGFSQGKIEAFIGDEAMVTFRDSRGDQRRNDEMSIVPITLLKNEFKPGDVVFAESLSTSQMYFNYTVIDILQNGRVLRIQREYLDFTDMAGGIASIPLDHQEGFRSQDENTRIPLSPMRTLYIEDVVDLREGRSAFNGI